MPSFQQPDEVFLRSGEVRRRYANASEIWLHRRLKDDSEFPKPIRIERYRTPRLGTSEQRRISAALERLGWQRAKKDFQGTR